VKVIVSVDSILADDNWFEPRDYRCAPKAKKADRSSGRFMDIYRPGKLHLGRSDLIEFPVVAQPTPTPVAEKTASNESSFEHLNSFKVTGLIVVSALALAVSVYQFISNGPLLLPVAIFVFCFFQALIGHRNQ